MTTAFTTEGAEEHGERRVRATATAFTAKNAKDGETGATATATAVWPRMNMETRGYGDGGGRVAMGAKGVRCCAGNP